MFSIGVGNPGTYKHNIHEMILQVNKTYQMSVNKLQQVAKDWKENKWQGGKVKEHTIFFLLNTSSYIKERWEALL